MHRHRPKHSGKNNLEVHGSRMNAYLPRAESTSDSLCGFGVIQEQDFQRWQHQHLWEEIGDCSEAKEGTFPPNKHFPEVTAVPLPLYTKESKFFDVSSQLGNSGYEDFVLQGNSEDVEYEVSDSNSVAFPLNTTGTIATSAGYEKPTPQSKTTVETSRSLEGLQPRSSFDDRQQVRNLKVDSGVRMISSDNRRSTRSLPFLQKPREEKCNFNYENKRVQGRKQESKSFSKDICVTKKVANCIPPEFQNLRHFLPLLTLCQCPDYDSAVIEIVQYHNDPCSGVASQTVSP